MSVVCTCQESLGESCALHGLSLIESVVVPAYQQGTGEVLVWLCERCGQPHPPGPLCNSGVHVGPGEEANGAAIKSVDLAEKCQGLDKALDFAFEELMWISEHPNRVADPCEEPPSSNAAIQLAERARASLAQIEALDPNES